MPCACGSLHRRTNWPHCCDADAVTAADLAQLGAAIARFHVAATVAPADSDFGRPDTIHRVTLDNFAELRALPEAAAWCTVVDDLERDVTALHTRLRPQMLERQAAGWVRECHGDLHCGNVVRWSGTLTPFDGIEFDPKLRFIDVVNDIAFLTMDLAERGHAELRRAVLQAWVEALGAWTRAAVAALLRDLSRAGAREGRRIAGAATRSRFGAARGRRRRLLALSRLGHGRASSPRRPALVITCGLSGSGKTWLARQLASRLGALHVRSDVERKRLAGLEAHADSRSPPDAGIYSLEFNERTYAHLHDCATAALDAGESIVVDAAFLRHGERQRFLDLARRVAATFTIVHCRAPEAVLRQRVAARAAARNDASEAGLDVLQRQPGYWEPFDVQQQSVVVPVDTSDSDAIDRTLEQIAHRDRN